MTEKRKTILPWRDRLRAIKMRAQEKKKGLKQVLITLKRLEKPKQIIKPWNTQILSTLKQLKK